ncbi:branched-chain amino acid ABC transporter permease, partial [Salmonella enterica subsp. enterica serovar Enteritidis]|nr:branched-chain amino acid ABC transporter permease [Salmonella enterica subsp. enterica serovar Enteritidis]
MALPPLDSSQWQSRWRAFAWGLRSITQTILT